MSLLGELLRRGDPVESRAIYATDYWGEWAAGNDNPGGLDPATGVNVTRDTALGVSAVWACMSLIGDSIATLPVDTFATNDDGSRGKPYRPRPSWLDNPNGEQTKVDFIFNQVVSLLGDGNAFVYTVRNRKGDVVEAWTLNPDWVQVYREYVNGKLQLVYYVNVTAGQQSPVGPFRIVAGPEMFHIMAFQASSGWPRGLSPIERARRMFGSGIAGQEMGARFFGHGMNAAGVIEVPDDFTIEQARELKRDFSTANGGLSKMHLPPVLTGGAKFNAIQISPEQAQFIEQRKFSVDEIARFFRVPPHMIGNLEKTTSWGTGIEQQSIGFVRYTLRPWIERLEEAWSKHMLLFEPKGTRVGFDVDGLMRGDAAAQAAYAQARFQTGWTHNDVRHYFGEAPIDDGDTSYFPVNFAPVGTEPLKVAKVDAEEPDLAKPITDDASSVPPDAVT